jgi:hypothetical protein
VYHRCPSGEVATRIEAAITTLLEAGVAAGTLRPDVAPYDVLVSLSGVTLASTDPQQQRRLLDLLIDGLRAGRLSD